MESEEMDRSVKRFKYQSYSKTLKDVHLPSALDQSQFDNDIADNDSHFHQAIDHWRQLNLSPSFLRFANKADGLSASMPLLLHHWKEIMDLWFLALESANDEALNALLDVLQKLAHDIRTTLSPSYDDILSRLVAFLPQCISADAITALLASFSALFKHVLIPNGELQLVERTWVQFRDILPKCNPEVQRATAEVWGNSLRKFKSTARAPVIDLLLTDLTGIEDMLAWIFVFACKSVAQSLHTATPSIISSLLNYHSRCEDGDQSYTLLRRVLTALIHHVKSAEEFSSVANIIIDQLNTTASDIVQLRRILPILIVLCSVRRGSRLSQPQLSQIASTYMSLTYSQVLHVYLLQLSTSILLAGEMSFWMGPGRHLVEYLWKQNSELAVELSASLSELNWGGWKMIAAPQLFKNTWTALEEIPNKTLKLLGDLCKDNKLNDADAVWKDRMGKWVGQRFTTENWQRTEGNVGELRDILTLSSILPSISKTFGHILEMSLEVADPLGDHKATYANSSVVSALCLQAVAKQRKESWPEHLTSRSVISDVCGRYGWSACVMDSLASVVNTRLHNTTSVSLQSVYLHLKLSLLSHSQTLRLSVLRLLASSAVITTPNEQDVIRKCLQGEEVSIDVHGVRERQLRISQVCSVVADGNDSAADIAARWLSAQLKVNLQPLWSGTANALSSLSERFGDLVWNLVFNNLQDLCLSGERTNPLPGWMSNLPGDEDADVVHEDERSWRDPSARKMRVATLKWRSEDVSTRDLIRVQICRDRFDAKSYEAQLLAVLCVCPSLAEKHNRELVPLLLSFVDPESPSKLARQKLSQWLTLFSKFSNPKALYATDKLHTLYVTLLSHPDRSLQRLALASILTYKSPHILPHQGTLEALLDDTRWRDELTALDIDQIEDQDRREYVEVLIRLLFGIMLEKRGRGRGGDRRATIISALGGCRSEELEVLVNLMLNPLHNHMTSRSGEDFEVCSVSDGLPEKQQIGYLNLLEDVLKNLGSRLVAYWPALLGTTLDLLANAQRRVDASKQSDDAEGSDAEVEEEESDNSATSSKMIRVIRQLSLKRLAEFFKCPVSFDFSPYMKVLFYTTISPRLASLDSENTQAPSALLEVIYVWSSRSEYARFLTDFDDRTLPKVYDCLVATNVKPAVISRIFDIVSGLLALSSTNEAISETVMKPHVSQLLTNLAILVGRTKNVASVSNSLGQRQIFILSEIAQYIADAKQASTLLGLFIPLLRRPSKIVPEKVKIDMINIVSSLLPLIPELRNRDSDVYGKTWSLLSRLLQSLRTRSARLGVISSFGQFAKIDSSLSSLVELLESLNAYSAKRTEEPDFDRRMQAFTKLNEEYRITMSPTQWLPVLCNMLYFIQDPTELALRTNASFTLRSFIDIVAQSNDKQWGTTFLKILYPGLKNGLRSKNQLVRAEVLGVIAHAVVQCQNIGTLQEMRGLLVHGDEEASFFNNIHHVQIHRRTRALRRLTEYCNDGKLRSSTLAEVFVPLVGNFIGATDSIDHNLVNEAIVTIGRMAGHLAWGSYNGLVQQYLQKTKQKDASERIYVRTIVAILDNFHFRMDDTAVDVEREDEDEGEVEVEEDTTNARESARIADAVNSRLIPALLLHLEKRDENEDSIRIPISVGIVNVVKHLPEHTREIQVTRLLTVLSQVFRSKSQETRDLTRDALCRIAVTLGPAYLPHIIRELRAALLRGPHLHVLAVVTHALLVRVTSSDHAESFSVMDDCVEDVAHVSAEVIFGQSGKDTQSEGFKTKVREVRSSSSKGLDSFCIIAKHITPIKVSSLLHPVRSILQETETLKVLQQADDVLRRIAVGLNSNKYLIPSELLPLCHSLISQNSRFLQDPLHPKRTKKDKGSAIVQLKRPAPTNSDHYANNSFRFVVFGLDLFNTAYRRNRFDFQDPKIIARLEPMVTIIGNTLYSQSGPVITLGLKAAVSVVKCPLKSVGKALPVIVGRTIEIIKETGSTESEVVQTAFRSLATILRDHPDAQVKEKDLIFLLELISPDLEEPSRQASAFSVLRAIIARKFVVPEIYDHMDKVSEIMVTNQSSQVQELCRSALLQFLLDYPQGKNRLRNQMTFLAKNLSYVYENGRKSVMELLSAVLAKFEPGLVREYGDLLFVGLVMVIANDESAKCREMAAELIKSLYSRLDDEHRKTLLSHLHIWASQVSQSSLNRVSCQVYGLIVDVQQREAESFIDILLADLDSLLQRSAQLVDTKEDSVADEMDLSWQVPYHALVVVSKVCGVFPDLITKDGAVDWVAIVTHLLYPHAWVRTAACRLIGTLFTAVPPGAPKSDSPDNLDSPSLFSVTWMENIANNLCLQLNSEYLDESLSLQIVKNLFYIGKCFSALPVPSDLHPDGDEGEDDDDDDDESDGEKAEKAEGSKRRYPVRWMFSKLSFQARSAYVARRNKSAVSHNWSLQPSSIFKWFAAMSTHVDPLVLEMFLVHILSPVYRVIEDDSIRDARMDDLKSTAVELQDLVRKKVGTTKFANVYNKIRQGVLTVQRERKVTRALQVTIDPEAAAKRKMQRNFSKKEGRKRKDTLFSEGKGRLKRRRKA